MITPPVIELSAVNVTEAIPFTVLADVAESEPAYGGREAIEKVTVVPSVTGLFRAFRTVADMFVVSPLVRFESTTLSEIDAGLLVIKKLRVCDKEPEVAVMVTLPEDEPE